MVLVQSTLRANNKHNVASRCNWASPTIFGRMSQVSLNNRFICIFEFMGKLYILNKLYQGSHSSSMGSGISNGYSGMVRQTNGQSKVDAKFPALLFKQHLTACVEKVYGMIRDALKKEISPFLNLCIQVSSFNKHEL